jgi:ankyrin repeat protein
LDKPSTGSTELLGAEIREFLRKHFSAEDPRDTISKVTRERFHVFEKYEFFSCLGRAVEDWKNCMQTKAQKSNKARILDLDIVLGGIRSTIDGLGSRQLSTSLPQKLQTFGGSKIFKCAKYNCEYFYGGFETIQERDRHNSRHDRTYYCTFPGCPKAIFGFEDSKALQQHFTGDHRAGHMDDSKYPVYQEPKSINIELAIKTGNIAAVERWAQQFDGCIPDKTAGIYLRNEKQKTGIHSGSLFCSALQRDDPEIAEFFLGNILSPGELGFAIIYAVMIDGNKSLLPWAVEIPMDKVDPRRAYQPISLAIARGDDLTALRLLKLLSSKSPRDLIPPRKISYVPLAGRFNCLLSLQYLIVDCEMDADAVDGRQRTALMVAAELGHTSIIKLLVDGGHCNIGFKNSRNETALSKAAANGHDHAIRILFPEHPVPDNVMPWLKVSQLRNAARSGNTEDIIRLLEDDGISVNVADADHYTPLLHAVENGHYSVVCALLDHRGDSVDVNYKCNCHHPQLGSVDTDRKSDGATALILGTIHGHVSIVRRLLQCKGIKTKESVRMKRGRSSILSGSCTALQFAEYNKDAEITALLQKPTTSVSVKSPPAPVTGKTSEANQSLAEDFHNVST